MSPYWSYYERSEPKAVKNGLKAKSKRGTIGETWWSRRWVAVLESFNLGARLTRGRSYARKGQVMSISVTAGSVRAKVQGTYPQPYDVTIKLKPLDGADWEKAVRAMAAKAVFSARLLCGEMPQNIEEAFSHSGVSLFPQKKSDLKTDCSCPDWSNPCKHIAAVYYLLAEEFDRDPFLIFKLRGKERDELMQELRAMRCEGSQAESEDLAAVSLNWEDIRPLQECLDCFWESGTALQSLEIRPRRPEVEYAILKQLGDSPFSVGRSNLRLLLQEIYSLAGENALKRAEQEEN
ncbi:MAG: SWIM zinc finger family protein [Methanothrix sp.]|nr:SWIM zinc finger family protein [Methanothrix sp.]